MMDDDCRGVRQRRKQVDSTPCPCPVCGITVRPSEMEQHYTMEMERLNKLSAQKYRKTQSTIGNTSTAATATAAATTPSNELADVKDCWNTYQRIKNNRSARLKVNESFHVPFYVFLFQLNVCSKFLVILLSTAKES